MRAQTILILLPLTAACLQPDLSDGPAVALGIEEVARYGSQFGEGSALTLPISVALTADELFVLEADPARVAVFDREGEWLRDLSRSGDGPGEVRRPTLLGMLDGEIWIGDPRGGRVEHLDEAGTPTRSVRWSMAADSQGTRSVPMALLADGSYLAGPAALPIGAIFTGAVDHRSYYRVEADGSTALELYEERIVRSDFASADWGGRQAVVAHPHSQAPIVRALANGAGLLTVERYVAEGPDSATFHVRTIAPDGSTSAAWDVAYTPRSAEGWRGRYRENTAEVMRATSGDVDETLLESMTQALAEIRYLPPVSEARTGMDGTVWLRREDTGSPSIAWDVYDPRGAHVGHLSLPSRTQLLHATLAEIWVVERDSLDVPFVVRYRLTGWEGQ